MQKGTIATLKETYGFIAVPGEEKNLFFHSRDLSGVSFEDLKEGDEVNFEATAGPKGPQASNVSRV